MPSHRSKCTQIPQSNWLEMVRTIHTRKRSRNGGPFRAFKRRKFTPRRVIRRRRSSYVTTSRNLSAKSPWGMSRRRKPNSKAFRRMLYRFTQPFTHYRSLATSTTDSITTAANSLDTFVYGITAMNTVAGQEFWKIGTGGFQDINFGVNPNWATVGQADPIQLVIRGGRIWCQVAMLNTGAAVDTCKVRVQLCFAKQQLRNTTDTANSNSTFDYLNALGIRPFAAAHTARPIGWNTGMAPDWEEYFYPAIIDKSFDMRISDDMMVQWKIKPCKIDTTVFQRGSGWMPYWFVYAYQIVDNDAASAIVAIKTGHNISFSVTDGPN